MKKSFISLPVKNDYMLICKPNKRSVYNSKCPFIYQLIMIYIYIYKPIIV